MPTGRHQLAFQQPPPHPGCLVAMLNSAASYLLGMVQGPFQYGQPNPSLDPFLHQPWPPLGRGFFPNNVFTVAAAAVGCWLAGVVPRELNAAWTPAFRGYPQLLQAALPLSQPTVDAPGAIAFASMLADEGVTDLIVSEWKIPGPLLDQLRMPEGVLSWTAPGPDGQARTATVRRVDDVSDDGSWGVQLELFHGSQRMESRHLRVHEVIADPRRPELFRKGVAQAHSSWHARASAGEQARVATVCDDGARSSGAATALFQQAHLQETRQSGPMPQGLATAGGSQREELEYLSECRRSIGPAFAENREVFLKPAPEPTSLLDAPVPVTGLHTVMGTLPSEGDAKSPLSAPVIVQRDGGTQRKPRADQPVKARRSSMSEAQTMHEAAKHARLRKQLGEVQSARVNMLPSPPSNDPSSTSTKLARSNSVGAPPTTKDLAALDRSLANIRKAFGTPKTAAAALRPHLLDVPVPPLPNASKPIPATGANAPRASAEDDWMILDGEDIDDAALQEALASVASEFPLTSSRGMRPSSSLPDLRADSLERAGSLRRTQSETSFEAFTRESQGLAERLSRQMSRSIERMVGVDVDLQSSSGDVAELRKLASLVGELQLEAANGSSDGVDVWELVFDRVVAHASKSMKDLSGAQLRGLQLALIVEGSDSLAEEALLEAVNRELDHRGRRPA